MPTDDVAIIDAASVTRTMRAVDIDDKLHQVVLRVVVDHPSAPTAVAFYRDMASRSDTYTGTGTGTTLDISAQGMSHFSVQVKGTGGLPGACTVELQGSLDGTNFSPLLTHTMTTPGDGGTLSTGAAFMPMKYIRSKCTAYAAGAASNIIATIMGTPT